MSDLRATTFGDASVAGVGLKANRDRQLLFQLELRERRWFLQPLAGTSTLRVNQVPIRGAVPLEHLAIIQADQHVLVFVERDDPTMSSSFLTGQWLVDKVLRAPKVPATGHETIEISNQQVQAIAQSIQPLDLPGTMELPERRLLIGRASNSVDICLPDVRVSRVHAWIHREGATARVADLKSANGTFVDGRPVLGTSLLREGHRLQIGPYSLVFTGTALYPLIHDKNVQLVARNLRRSVVDLHRRGNKRIILDDITLVIRPREFVCILGPSGSGKTTLLSALSGRQRADEGTVLLNGEDLYEHFDALKQNLAVVPQKDVLHDVLPLHLALRYTAKLRLPADISRHELDARIDEMLDAVNLTQHQFTQIRRLSGGQIKRASWVNEAICQPSLIFLDEVTSGLDEQSDREMMRLLRRMADNGKTIVCVTHGLGNVEQNCHLVVVLSAGGVLAFFGPPAEAVKHFDISRLGEVYQRLREKSPAEWRQQFRESAMHEQFVERRLPRVTAAASVSSDSPKRKPPRRWVTAWRQFYLLTRRYLAVQLADKRALAMMLGQSLFIAGLLVWLFGDISNLNVEDEARQLASEMLGVGLSELFAEDQAEFRRVAEEIKRADYSSKVLFLLCISCIWFGCNNAAKELIKERSIYAKERDVGLFVTSYYGSKLFLLGVLSVLQASLLFWTVLHFTQLGGEGTPQWLLLSLASLTGVGMGLAISAVANSEDTAVTLVPISLIPQIVLAGLIAPLTGHAQVFSRLFISAYWAYQGLLGRLEAPLQTRLRTANNLDLDVTWSLDRIASVLLAHIVVFALLALAALCARNLKDKRWSVFQR